MYDRSIINIYLFMFILSGIILIGLNVYTITSDKISDNLEKTIKYSEIPFSFMVSLPMLVMFFVSLLFISQNILKKINMDGIIFSLFMICNPFFLTVIKTILQKKEYDKYFIGPIILSTGYSFFYTYGLLSGKGHR